MSAIVSSVLQLGKDIANAVWLEVDDRLPVVIRTRKHLSEQMQDMVNAGRHRGQQEVTKQVAAALARSGNAAAFEREMQRQDEQQPRRLTVIR